jgi:hypothetical protein
MEGSVPIDDKAEVLKRLVRDGKARGYVRSDEVWELLPEGCRGQAEFDDTVSELATKGINVLPSLMKRSQLSRFLADHISFLDEGLRAEELSEHATEREALLQSVEQLYQPTKSTAFTEISATYEFLSKFAGKFPRGYAQSEKERVRDWAAYQLDDCLSRLMVSQIPRMVSRALRLEPMLIEEGRQADENPYLREATRCFMFGLFNASVALSRSALEEAFLKKIPILLQGKSREDTLEMLIKTARNSVLKGATGVCDLADKVRRTANAIVHGKPCQEAVAFEVLRNTRRIVHRLYGSARSL